LAIHAFVALVFGIGFVLALGYKYFLLATPSAEPR